MLKLDDERWKTLSQRMGNAYPFITDSIRELQKDPLNQDLFDEMIPHLCSEGTTWDAAYAAIPYLVEIAKQISPKERINYLCWIGLIVIDANSIDRIDEFLRDNYIKAIEETTPLILETLKEDINEIDITYLLAALSALKGYPKLGEVISNLEFYTACPVCEAVIFDFEESAN